MKNKITIEQSEEPEVDMDDLLRCYEYMKRAENEQSVISESTILRIVILSAVLVFTIVIILIGYFSGDGFILLVSIMMAFMLILVCGIFMSGD